MTRLLAQAHLAARVAQLAGERFHLRADDRSKLDGLLVQRQLTGAKAGEVEQASVQRLQPRYLPLERVHFRLHARPQAPPGEVPVARPGIRRPRPFG